MSNILVAHNNPQVATAIALACKEVGTVKVGNNLVSDEVFILDHRRMWQGHLECRRIDDEEAKLSSLVNITPELDLLIIDHNIIQVLNTKESLQKLLEANGFKGGIIPKDLERVVDNSDDIIEIHHTRLGKMIDDSLSPNDNELTEISTD
ncbi:MAG: hypothetical protein Q9M91_06645 [Candidatus Dojkabacteria bacterium]|nr:hypothetical protein [Candidatus Dojkabacteria bacterium]MDQ7021474.1 hypothetical protein [Candidatus Dojkabacteria bacterium]